jgi:hypothetical protein
MKPGDLRIGTDVMTTVDNVFRWTVFTVVGHADRFVRVRYVSFGREVEIELEPSLLKPACPRPPDSYGPYWDPTEQ